MRLEEELEEELERKKEENNSLSLFSFRPTPLLSHRHHHHHARFPVLFSPLTFSRAMNQKKETSVIYKNYRKTRKERRRGREKSTERESKFSLSLSPSSPIHLRPHHLNASTASPACPWTRSRPRHRRVPNPQRKPRRHARASQRRSCPSHQRSPQRRQCPTP